MSVSRNFNMLSEITTNKEGGKKIDCLSIAIVTETIILPTI